MTKSGICPRQLILAGVLVATAAVLTACPSDSNSTRVISNATTAVTPMPPTATPTSVVNPTPRPTAAPTSTASPTPRPTPVACNSGNQYTFVNNNPYPVWLAEEYQGSGDVATNTIAPPGNDWKMTPNSSVALCMPSGWSGRFWPRTECDFSGLFSNDTGFKDCSSTSECDSSTHTCVGGKCLLNCSAGGTSFCQTTGLNNASAICYAAGAGVQVCSFPQGTVCKTGDCSGLYQCTGSWDDIGKPVVSHLSGAAPASLFEPTSNGTANVNYDVSLVSGYNTQIQVIPSAAVSGANCYTPSCVSDLNVTCPANLRVTEVPTTTVSTIPCGSVGDYCQSGVCDSGTCIIGCNDPGDQCAQANPPGLMCGSAIPAPSATPTPTYQSMYAAKGPDGNSMSSCGQATPTCWGPGDCAPNVETCVTGAIAGFPSGLGICAWNPPIGGLYFAPQAGCSGAADVGKPCGNYLAGYPIDALDYVCTTATYNGIQYVCVPQYDPPITGLGTLEHPVGQTPLYTGEACPINPAWLTATTQAGGGTTPWYETFSAACPHEYAFQYDDHSGGLDCASGGQVNMTVTFGPVPSATPRP